MENIIFKTPIECLDYVKNIKAEDNTLSSIDRKILFKARQYFIDNLNNFNDEEISYLLSNKYFKKFTDLQATDLISICNSNDKDLPHFLKQWANCDEHILKPYLQKISTTNPEQLRQFFENENGKNIIIEIFNQQKSQSSILVDLAIIHDPINILKSKWEPEKIVQWLEKNPEHAFKFANHFGITPTENYDPLIKDKVFELVISQHILDKKRILDSTLTSNDTVVIFLSNLGERFIDKFKERDFNFLDSIMKKNILFKDVFFSSNQVEKPVIILNTAQYIYIKNTKNWRKDNAENILSHFTKTILKPIEINFYLHKYKENIFEYSFKNNMQESNFVLGLKQEFLNLNIEQKKMYVASSIKLLSQETNVSSNLEKLTDLLEVVPSKMTNLYLSKVLEALSENVLPYVSSKFFKYGLEKKLSEDTQKIKQPKI